MAFANTTGGMLLFGSDRLTHFPGAWIQAGRFAGKTAAASPTPPNFGRIFRRPRKRRIPFLQEHMIRKAVIGAMKRTGQWTFPAIAIREAIMNAIAQADYAQRGAPVPVALFEDRQNPHRRYHIASDI